MAGLAPGVGDPTLLGCSAACHSYRRDMGGGRAGKRFAARRVMWMSIAGFFLIELEPISLIVSSWLHPPPHPSSTDMRTLLGVDGLPEYDYGGGVPRVLHQTWKDHQPPAELDGYIKSWHVQVRQDLPQLAAVLATQVVRCLCPTPAACSRADPTPLAARRTRTWST